MDQKTLNSVVRRQVILQLQRQGQAPSNALVDSLLGNDWWLSNTDSERLQVSDSEKYAVAKGGDQMHPDAELLDACRQFDAIECRYQAAWKDVETQEEWERAENVCKAPGGIDDEHDRLRACLVRLHATTLEGHVARAKSLRLFADHFFEDDGDDKFSDVTIRSAILRDLVRDTQPDLRPSLDAKLIELCDRIIAQELAMDVVNPGGDIPGEMKDEFYRLVEQMCELKASTPEGHMARVRAIGCEMVKNGKFLYHASPDDNMVFALVRDVLGVKEQDDQECAV
ncbi:hypothetical protein AA13595_0059 [Gluconacetobacter johannae DSM 13595]|uniref:Uncharacterized protein n=1 Tax=Gluconacetobacter johannae TaxID=112140 RepID=A0A7W4J8X9_9PROT|nr:hypothetical protein [Gluconacetobacter johannae]MBB2176738.1 hypothetical protein [Gluconacetobacter johannae]GBQ79556.1 hypothetical protein AA13595_0059 [Gluconacetobacter johannae DSM 13595]